MTIGGSGVPDPSEWQYPTQADVKYVMRSISKHIYENVEIILWMFQSFFMRECFKLMLLIHFTFLIEFKTWRSKKKASIRSIKEESRTSSALKVRKTRKGECFQTFSKYVN